MSSDIPALIHWKRDARNGHAPAAQFYQRAVEALNHHTGYGGREVFQRSWDQGVLAGVTGTTNIARFRFRSKHGANRLTFFVHMGLAASSGVDPYCEIDVTEVGGGTTTLNAIHYGESGTVTLSDAPDEWLITDRSVDITGATTYEVLIKSVDYARVLSVMAYEESDRTVVESTDYYSGLVPAAGVPIYDVHREQLLAGLSNMYCQNAGTLYHWGLSGTARTRSSATLINLIDNTTTGTPTVAAPGVYLNNTCRNTASRTTVPYELGVYASIGAGSGTVRLTDDTGTDRITVTVNGAAGWYTATGLLPNTDTFYALRFNGDGANTVSVLFASLIEWESR